MLLTKWMASCAVVLGVLFHGSVHAAPLVHEGKDGWLFPLWESYTEIQKSHQEMSLAHLQFLNTQFAAHNVQLVVMVVPMKAAFYPDRVPAGQPVSTDVLKRYGDVMSALQAAAIPTFDDAAILRRLEVQQIPAFFRTDYHWTGHAAEASADAAAEVIRQQVRFAKAPAGGSQLGEWTRERRYGDLALRFLTAEQRMAVGRDVFQVRTAPLQQTQSLLDDEFAEIHVVGNSFVQPYLGFPQKLSQALNRPVSLTWKFGNIGPWFTMLSYLESAEYQQNKPRVVLWQLNESRLGAGPQDKDAWDAEAVLSVAEWRSRVAAALLKTK
jgi:alginate O-acetyltransferase complex protein AlgJ